jgi:hypothetical protein
MSTVCFDDALHDEQAEPGTGAARMTRLPIAIEDVLPIALRNSAPRVANANADFFAEGMRGDGNHALGRREFYRVANQIGEHLKNPLSIASHYGEGVLDLCVKRN